MYSVILLFAEPLISVWGVIRCTYVKYEVKIFFLMPTPVAFLIEQIIGSLWKTFTKGKVSGPKTRTSCQDSNPGIPLDNTPWRSPISNRLSKSNDGINRTTTWLLGWQYTQNRPWWTEVRRQTESHCGATITRRN